MDDTSCGGKYGFYRFLPYCFCLALPAMRVDEDQETAPGRDICAQFC
jgi:hypothetical protein